MNQKYLAGCFTLIVVAIGLIVLSGAAYTVNMREQVVITQFGEPKGKPITEAGLKFKIPFIQKANVFDKRILPWDGPVSQMPTKEKTLIMVDTYARWQISDPLTFLRRLRDERTASSRLNDILGSETRNTIAKHELIEVIRTTKGRVPEQSEVIVEGDTTGVVGVLPPISRGRSALERDIYETSKIKLEEFGIKLLDIRFKRVNYNQTVEGQIYQRMISERK
ncbi:MAG TPA: protease modulator HflC, partial [Verrucomicrobiales bacterium]|nr:protease modulator HflC [Verrucomicrobiales bacterium]